MIDGARSRMSDARLYEFDKEEWWDVFRAAVRMLGGEPPDRDEFDRDWDEFCELKRRKAMQ